jgi:hypothetical protein
MRRLRDFRIEFFKQPPSTHSVIAGHSRPKDGVASARLCPAIHLLRKMILRRMMDARVKPGHDEYRHLDSRHTLATSRRDAPEPLINLSPPLRAWGMPGARCTRGLVCNCSDRTHTSNNEYTGIARHSRTQWF